MAELKGQVITEYGQECIGCRAVKPWNAFQRDRSRKNGYRTRCKECQKKTKGKKKYYVINKIGRECTSCRDFKPWSEFHKCTLNRHGYKCRCKGCRRRLQGKKKKKQYIINENGRQCTRCKEFKPWSKFNKLSKTSLGYTARCRDCTRAKIYGLSVQEMDRLKIRSRGRCEVCGNDNGDKDLAIDHDHITGEVRGLLCDSCNFLIGMAKDDTKILRRAILYLDGDIDWSDLV